VPTKPKMSLTTTRPLTYLFIISLLITSAFCSQVFQKAYYIDPSDSGPEGGDIQQPFHSLATAFAKVQEDMQHVEATQELEIIFYCSDSAEFIDFDNNPTLSLDNGSRPPSTIIFRSYSKPGSTPNSENKPKFIFRNPSAHVVFSIRNTKLNFEAIAFSFNVQGAVSGSELIEVKGEYTEVIFNGCRFFDSISNFQNPNAAVFNLKNGRYLIKNSVFESLDMTNPLFQVDDSRNGLMKFELNKFTDIKMTGNPFTKVRGVTSFDFVENTVERSFGTLFAVTTCRNIVIHQNTFDHIYGKLPFEINAVQNLIIEKSKIRYHFADGEHRGFLSIVNFNTFHLKDTTVEGYSGSKPVFTVLMDDSYQPQGNSMVNVKNAIFTKNSLVYNEAEDQTGLALFRVGIKEQNTKITIADSVFAESKIVDERDNQFQRNLAASTIWIQADKSTFDLKNTTLRSNKASRALTNLYVNAEAVRVSDSKFIKNGQIDSADPTKNNAGLFTSLSWYGDDLHFMGCLFEENYADQGGAISILEEDSPRLPHTVLIEGCKFVKNKAKSGGAIFNNVASEKLSGIQLKGNQFEGNEADEFPNTNENAKFSTGTKLNIYLEETYKGKKKRYESGELLIQNAISGQSIDHVFEIFLSDSKVRRAPIGGHYISSIKIVRPDNSTESSEMALLENFTKKETGASFKLDHITVFAPAGSVSVIRATMQNRDKSEEVYTFEFKVSINKEVINCNLGEFYSTETKYCTKCPPGKFSIERNTKKCWDCPFGADCSEGGHRIKLLQGYWRDMSVMFDEDVVVYECAAGHKEHCLGGLDSRCRDGYIGPLCSTCDTTNTNPDHRYRPFLRDTCKLCNPVSLVEIAEDVLALTVPAITLLYTVYALLSSKKGLNQGQDNSDKKLKTCLYVNLFIGYMQNLFVLDTLGYVSVPSSVLYVVNIFANPTFPTFGFLTCHFRTILPFYKISEAYIRFLSMYGFILAGKALCLIIVVKLFNKNRNFLKSAILSLIWLSILETPGVLDFLLRFFDCHQVGHTTYSSFSLHIECDAQFFTTLKTYMLVPAVLLIAGFFPLAVTYSLIKGALRSDENDLHKKMKILALARSAEHIDKSNRNWLSFFWVAFGRFGLLAVAAAETQGLWNIAAAAFYYATVILFNKSRKISLYQNWRSNLLLIDAGVVLLTLGSGYVASSVGEEAVRDLLRNFVLVMNAGYFIFVYGGNLFSSDGNSTYGKLDDNTMGQEVPGSSESEEENEGQNRAPSADNLDETI